MTSAGRPLYFRLLRIRRLRARPLATFLLFEGSIVLGVLLALAEIINWWGMLAVPVAVAIMVKLHDAVAVALGPPSQGRNLPLAGSGQGTASRGWLDLAGTGTRPAGTFGVRTVPGATAELKVAGPGAATGVAGPGAATGVAAVPVQIRTPVGSGTASRPSPGPREPAPPVRRPPMTQPDRE
jgi:hypothetical protein